MEITDNLKKIAMSTELSATIQKIADVFGLHIDQMGDLGSEIRTVIYGIHKSSDFVKNVEKRLEIDEGLALKIADKVNIEIFMKIRDQVRIDTTSPENTDISNLEKLGNFTIDRPIVEPKIDVTPADRPVILNNVENPIPTKPTEYKPIDPLIDHLLANPVSSVTETIKVADAPVKPAEMKPNLPPIRKSDSYRESI